MATRQDLCLATLRKFGIPGAGQTASAEDIAAVNAVIDGAMDELSANYVFSRDGVPDSGSIGSITSGNIAAGFVDPLAGYLTKFVADDFGQSMSEAETRAALAESRLRVMQYEAQTDEPIRFQSF